MNTKAKSRRYRADARKLWPKAEWISGKGPYASVSECHTRPTVMLCETLADATTSKAFIDKYACGGRCVRAHRVVHLGGGEA